MSRRWSPKPKLPRRGQSNLVAVAVALVALTGATALGLALADIAFTGTERPVEDRSTAVTLSERLVAPDGPLTERANVLNATAIAEFDDDRLAEEYPSADGHAVLVRLDDRTLVEQGDPRGGYTVQRIVLIEHRSEVTRTPGLEADAVTLPRRTDRVDLVIDPPDETTVTTVRADDRIVLHDPSGLDGEYVADVSRFETIRLAFEADGPLPEGSVEVTYYPPETRKGLLEVTVDA